MVFKSKKGYYQLLVDFKVAFNLEKFEEYYIEECLDKYQFIVGDLSDGALRLKGFNGDLKDSSYPRSIDKYLDISCVFEAPYYILKRITSDKEYLELEEAKVKAIETPKVKHLTLEKENFDKEGLILEFSSKNKPNIILDLARINRVPIGSLPNDLKDEKDSEEKTVTTVVSSSAEFVPKERPKNFDNNRKKQFNKNNRNKRKEG